MKHTVDICIIGAGSAGLSVASGAAQLGLSTILVEKSDMGGDCLNTGCVPSKALIAAANKAQEFRSADKFGIHSQEPSINFSAVNDHVKDIIAQIEPHDSQERFEGLGVTVIREAAHFISDKILQAGEHSIKARYFVIATGSRARVPDIHGMDKDNIFTNENIFDLRQAPEHLIIIGGGPIGIEMAQAHRRLGAKVTVIDAGKILSHDDVEIVGILKEKLESEGIKIHEDTAIQSISHSENSVSVNLQNGEEIKGSHLLVAIGRTPNIETLGLDKAGVKTNQKGVIVDDGLQTSQPHIFAAGDVSGGPQFTHVAGYHAGILIRRIAFKMWFAKTDYSALPWVTYTDPALAHVGMTMKQAKEKYGVDNIQTIGKSLPENDRARAERIEEGMIKIIALNNGQILGVTILSPHAGDLLGLWTLAISKKMKLKDITAIIAPYPTLGELSKAVAGEWYKESLFSNKTKKIIRFLQKLTFIK